MSVTGWARQFGSFVDMAMKFFEIEVLPGTDIKFLDVFLWCTVASILIFFISELFD